MTDLKGFKNFLIFSLALIVSFLAGTYVSPTWTVEKISLDVHQDRTGRLYYIYRGAPQYLDNSVAFQEARLNPDRVAALNASN